MKQILIIEDEKPIREKLKALLRECFVEKVSFEECSSLGEARPVLAHGQSPDLIFMDILFSDGCGMDLFDHMEITTPVVFTTAREDYWSRSFDANGIDYIIKPYNKKDIQEAVIKYQKLDRHFQSKKTFDKKENIRQRILVKKGFSFLSLDLQDIAYFYMEHKLTMLRDLQGNRYMVDRTLSELESELSGPCFFRLNRQFLCHIQSVKNFKTHTKGRLATCLEPAVDEEIIISQENAARFKKWMDGVYSEEN